MTAASARHADCPPWCASDHTGTDETSRPLPHFGAPAFAGPASPVMVYPALLDSPDGPEIIIDRVLRPGEQRDPERPATWVRLDPGQAANLADIMGRGRPGHARRPHPLGRGRRHRGR
ncbi:MAG: hypothetical protein ACRDPY_20550 [Streptosporangiaceae bacterium]